MPNVHAPLPPSAGEIWTHCSAFLHHNAANAHGLQCDTDDTLEGTAAHAVFAAHMTGSPVPETVDAQLVTAEMRECGEFAATEAKKLLTPGPYNVESFLMPDAYLGYDIFGTTDLNQWQPGNTLFVLDYKYGHHYVPTIGNRQLGIYAILAICARALAEGVPYVHIEGCTRVRFAIIQPRCFVAQPVRLWEVPATWLRNLANVAAAQAAEARTNPVEKAGDHCRYCPGRLSCTAYRQHVSHGVDLALQYHSIEKPTPAEIGARLSIARSAQIAIDGMVDALEQFASCKMAQGERIPGWHLEAKQTRRTWGMDDDTVITMGDLLGVDLRTTKAKTPAQAEKAGVHSSIINQLSGSKSGEQVPAPDDLDAIQYLFRKG